MNERLADYLWHYYRREVLGERVKVVPPELTPEVMADAKLALANIDSLHRTMGATLASRDFAAYQQRRALVELLKDAP